MPRLFWLLTFICLVGMCHSFWPFSSSSDDKEKDAGPQISPVIFIPGDGGSQMEAALNKANSPYIFCAKVASWFSIWLNLEIVVVPAVYCLVDNMKLHYDPITRTTHNTPGVDIRIPGWGDPEVVEWVDPTRMNAGAYFKDIAEMLVKMGYERRKNLLGAPYDFRKAPNEHKQFFIDLKKLVEDTYEENQQTAVTFITHSMGSPLLLVFLQSQTMEWKQKYVKRQISLAGAWAGSVKALKVFAMGDDLDSFFLNGNALREEQMSCPSTAWLLPSPLFWHSNEPLVITPSHQYSVLQLEQFFQNLDYTNGWEMRKDTMRYTLNLNPPDVELHCIYGDGVKTVERLRYKKDEIAGETPTLEMGLGDGTVNQRSLKACHHWTDFQDHNISTMSLSGVNHMDILANHDVLSYINSVLRVPSMPTYEDIVKLSNKTIKEGQKTTSNNVVSQPSQ